MRAGAQSVEVPYGWVVIVASLIINSIGLGAPTILFVSLKPIAADLETLRSIPSTAYSLLMLGSGVGGIAMGWWMDRRGILQPVLFGSVMIGLGALLASHAQHPFGLLAANGLLIGLFGKSALIAPLVANATRWFDRRRGLAVAIIASGQGLAGTLWPPIVQHLNDLVGWRGTYFWFGLTALLTMVPLAFLLRPAPPVALPESRRESTSRQVTESAGFSPGLLTAILWVAVVGCCAAMSMPIVHLVSHMTDLGHAPVRAAEALALLFAAAFVSRIAFGMLSDRIGPVITLIVGSSCQALFLGAFAFVESLPALYVTAALFGLGFAGIMPCYALLIRALFPASQAGWRIASQYMFGAVGMALGGWLGGVVFDLTGSYTPAFLTGVAFNGLNLVLVVLLGVRYRSTVMLPA